MKNILIILLMSMASMSLLYGQSTLSGKQKKDISALIDQYSLARENRDTVLLKNILTNDIDQLVSTGEWRDGIKSSVQGMLNSSAATPGTRTLTVEKMKLLNQGAAIVDCRYEIKNPDGT